MYDKLRLLFTEIYLRLCSFQALEISLVVIDRMLTDDFTKSIFAETMVTVYNYKNTRLYQKEYSINELDKTIIKYAFEKLDVNDYFYEEYDNLVLDPFTLKPLFQKKGSYVKIIPIIYDTILEGFFLIYLDDDTTVLNYQDIDYHKLINKVSFFEKCIYMNEIEKAFTDEIKNQSYWIINIDDNYLLLSNEIMHLISNSSNYLSINNDNTDKINEYFLEDTTKSLKLSIKKEIKQLKLTIYRLKTKQDVEHENFFLTYESLEKREINEIFSLIYYRDLNNDNIWKLKEKLINALNQNKQKYTNIYKVNNNSICGYFNYHINKKEFTNIFKNLKEFNSQIILIKSNEDISIKSNLKKLIDFLEIVEEDEFKKEYYEFYIKKCNEEEYHQNQLINNKKTIIEQEIINSKTREVTTIKLINLINGMTKNNYFEWYNHLINYALKKNIQNPIISIDLSFLSSRKGFNMIKKYNMNTKHGKILIEHSIYTDNYYLENQKINYILDKLLQEKIDYYLSSNLAYNSNFLRLVYYAKGVYFNLNEQQDCENINEYTESIKILQSYINIYLKINKKIILEVNRKDSNLFDSENIDLLIYNN